MVDIEEDVRLEGMDEYIRQTSLNRYPQSKIQVNYLSNIVSIEALATSSVLLNLLKSTHEQI